MLNLGGIPLILGKIRHNSIKESLLFFAMQYSYGNTK